ncbi:MAG: hypothetical protein QMD95_00975 [Candidatus Hodarchaeaceae archaeon]|nr:hypothetical protein [Candidatus Hodarchaeaceae archaeon]
MSLRVDLKKWGGKNLGYITAWIAMGIVLLVLLVWRLRLGILVLIGPFIPYLAITLARIYQEMRK